MTNAFNWKQYTTEERANRGETRNENNTSLKRSAAASKTVERARAAAPAYGTVSIGTKVVVMFPSKVK